MTKWGSNSLLPILLTTICFYAICFTAAAPKPSAISIPVRTDWFGYDGNWSPVSVRVGTPPQWVDIFVSTASQETWVVGNGGCDGNTECLTKRGDVFQSNESTTWADQGPFVLGLDPQLGFGGDGIYGFDNISLSDDISVPSQVVGVINTTDYWLGFFGLGVEPTNFTSDDKPTFLDSMVETMGLIPSHSYGYTAGAYYRLKNVPASLVLGGFDANRFEPHDITFDLDPNQNPVVALNEITVTAQPLPSSNVSIEWPSNSLILLGSDEANLFTIDSSTPYLWLPEAVCLKFAKAFGLTYDNAVQLYTFGSDPGQREVLLDWNMTFQFAVVDFLGSSNSVSLSLPYKAFDLQLSYPYPGLNATPSSLPTNYFPLRKAANNTQYTIGRTFLQETYLKVDYERNNFSIFQATFSPTALTDTNLISITRPKNSTFTGPEVVPPKPILSKAGIAGVAVGGAIALVSLFCLIVLYVCFRRGNANHGYVRKEEGAGQRRKKTSNSRFLRWLFGLPKPETPTEIGGSDRFAFEAPTGRECMELPAKTSKSELEGSEPDIPVYTEVDYKSTENAVNAIGHDPDEPVELPYCSSARGYYEPEITSKVRISDSAPAPVKLLRDLHGMSRQNTQTTAGISSPSNTPSKRSSKDVSPTFIVSPITPREASPGFSSLSTIARREAWDDSRKSRGGQGIRRGRPDGSDDGKTGGSKSSNGTSVTRNIPRSAPRVFSWETDPNPERRVVGTHTPTDSTIHALP
ncbi:MAG: hypothetical protein ALECFALPRED_006806 [Alectoria fallacina]|uniref:Peptidase A1 domain-containing protein n=1 Tax=Alectoria fallacina TaxID=1903189 RepID=A0A8H3I0X8_9LECA|nr:MAG: hypothetical protein ALECFALPRED_006806 [Alectoria fallacina]